MVFISTRVKFDTGIRIWTTTNSHQLCKLYSHLTPVRSTASTGTTAVTTRLRCHRINPNRWPFRYYPLRSRRLPIGCTPPNASYPFVASDLANRQKKRKAGRGAEEEVKSNISTVGPIQAQCQSPSPQKPKASRGTRTRRNNNRIKESYPIGIETIQALDELFPKDPTSHNVRAPLPRLQHGTTPVPHPPCART